MTAVKLHLSPHRMSTLSIIADQLSKQAEWKAWVADKYAEQFEVGLSREERIETISVYQRILLLCDAAKAEKDDALKPPQSKEKQLAESSAEAFVQELSWLQQIEHKASLFVMITLPCHNKARKLRPNYPPLSHCCVPPPIRSRGNSASLCAKLRPNKRKLRKVGFLRYGAAVKMVKRRRRLKSSQLL